MEAHRVNEFVRGEEVGSVPGDVDTLPRLPSIQTMVENYKSGVIDPQVVVGQAIARSRELGVSGSGVAFVDERLALAAAAEIADKLMRGETVGRLAGVPIVVKDNIAVAGIPLTPGSYAVGLGTPSRSAAAVRRLTIEGAVVIGKSHLAEWALGATSRNPYRGVVRNPWNRGRSPGGSSGGSAIAVAAGVVPASLGTDTGGSVRIPAALCGVAGLRPAVSTVSLQGVVPVSRTLDTVGPLARSVCDLRLLLEVMRRGNLANPPTRKLTAVRVGVLETEGAPLRDEVLAIVQGAVEQLGDEYEKTSVEVNEWVSASEAARVILQCEAAWFHRDRLREGGDIFGRDVLQRLTAGAKSSAVEYLTALEFARKWRRKFGDIFKHIDVLLTPTCCDVAPLIQDEDPYEVTEGLTYFTYPVSLSGLAALTVPCGMVQGLPVGMQVCTPAGREALMFDVAEDIEASWRSRSNK